MPVNRIRLLAMLVLLLASCPGCFTVGAYQGLVGEGHDTTVTPHELDRVEACAASNEVGGRPWSLRLRFKDGGRRDYVAEGPAEGTASGPATFAPSSSPCLLLQSSTGTVGARLSAKLPFQRISSDGTPEERTAPLTAEEARTSSILVFEHGGSTAKVLALLPPHKGRQLDEDNTLVLEDDQRLTATVSYPATVETQTRYGGIALFVLCVPFTFAADVVTAPVQVILIIFFFETMSNIFGGK
jgi:hypothetical protein